MRIERGMSQADLAYALNVSPGFIGKVESGKYGKAYNVEHINRLAGVFDCSPRSFLPENAL